MIGILHRHVHTTKIHFPLLHSLVKTLSDCVEPVCHDQVFAPYDNKETSASQIMLRRRPISARFANDGEFPAVKFKQEKPNLTPRRELQYFTKAYSRIYYCKNILNNLCRKLLIRKKMVT